MSPLAAIVSVGNELLFGETVDTNAAWLGRELAARGIAVRRRYTVGDSDGEIREALAAALETAELVLVTGGLGPTPDDRTKAAVSALLELPLVVDEGARRQVEARFRAAGLDEVPALSRGQYEVPRGARVLRNPAGTAPGLLLRSRGSTLALFPGVPQELRAIFSGDFAIVLAELTVDAGLAPVHHRVVHTTGRAETLLAEALEPAIAGLPEEIGSAVELAYLPDLYGVDLRLTVRGGTSAEAAASFDAWVAALDPVLGPWRFESEQGDLAEAVLHELRAAGRTVAVAESCTGGLLGARITAVPGASDVFLGGVIAYANTAKEELGVSRATLDRYGAVSEPVARRLAEGVAERFEARVGLSITGVAGPGGGTDEKPVGTVWIGLRLDGRTEARCERLPGNRTAVRERAAQAALALLYRTVTGPSPGRPDAPRE